MPGHLPCIMLGRMLPALIPVDDPLRIVTTAVTPVVMVSATAILISGVNARYISISDRMRNLAGEFRREPVTPQRRDNIRGQMVVFSVRLRLVEWASRVLYVAVGAFVGMALLISLSVRHAIFEAVTLPLFLLGLVLIIAAICLQSLELKHSERTINLETAEVLHYATGQDRLPAGTPVAAYSYVKAQPESSGTGQSFP